MEASTRIEAAGIDQISERKSWPQNGGDDQRPVAYDGFNDENAMTGQAIAIEQASTSVAEQQW